jgi:hypothetical protein
MDRNINLRRTLRLTIGPDPMDIHGIVYHVDLLRMLGDIEPVESGGWRTRGPKPETPAGWLRRAHERGLFKGRVRGTVDAVPYGWSLGRGHAPGGIVVTFEQRIRR